jgi:hypothetical protein
MTRCFILSYWLLACCLAAQTSKAVEKAIKTSPLSLNATTEGSEVLVKLPRMTQENIERMIKLVHMEAEGANQSIRRARQKGMDAIKKAFKSASQDEKKRQEKEVCVRDIHCCLQWWTEGGTSDRAVVELARILLRQLLEAAGGACLVHSTRTCCRFHAALDTSGCDRCGAAQQLVSMCEYCSVNACGWQLEQYK